MGRQLTRETLGRLRVGGGVVNMDDFVNRADEILVFGSSALSTRQQHRNGLQSVNPNKFALFRSASLSFLESVFGSRHPYYTDFSKRVTRANPTETEAGMGIMTAARNELAAGWLQTARGLLSAEIFEDFLEMADHLLSEKYKDAAAVIIGSSLEEHLRQLAIAASIPTTRQKDGVDIPLKAEALNSELAKAGVYSKLDQKNVTAWLGLRNDAAHGEYEAYDHAQVRLMLDGVRQFMSRVQPTPSSTTTGAGARF